METITNDALKAQYSSQFELVKTAIELATHIIHGAQLTPMSTSDQSVILQVIKELKDRPPIIHDYNR